MRFADQRALLATAVIAFSALVTGCGGGSSSSSSSSQTNTQAIMVNAGPTGNYANGLFTNVTVCAPGTSNCQTISGVLVDTGSFGLRVLSSALGTVASSLPQQTTGGNPNVECAQFVSSVTWGPVKTADISLAGEKASSVPIQVIDSSIAPVPSACSAIGPAEQDLASLGTNGILGVGFFISDCGNACAQSGSGNPGFYYTCNGSSCQVIAQSTSLQVQNPVALFPQDNNGLVLELPTASASAASLSGSLIFGIGTESNNSLGSAQIYHPDSNGNLKTSFNSTTYEGFLDSGSNAYFFLGSSASGLPDCPSPNSGFYCPSSPTNLTAINSSDTGSGGSGTINFTIGNADQLFSSPTDAVFPTLGGSNPNTFDWGLPFFYGRKVFVEFQAPVGNGPYWAY
jgi:Protein of unknown function (DUF3443)